MAQEKCLALCETPYVWPVELKYSMLWLTNMAWLQAARRPANVIECGTVPVSFICSKGIDGFLGMALFVEHRD